MIINKIHVKGFKSLWDTSISFGRLNVFIGTNGAGKSNLLEAIAVLSSSFEGGVDYERLARRGARLSSHEIFRSSLKHKKRLSSFTIEAEIGDLIYRSSINSVNNFNYHSEALDTKDKKRLAGRSNVGSTLLGAPAEFKIDSSRSIISLYTAFAEEKNIFQDIERFAIYSPSTPILRGVSPDNSNRAPLGLYGGRLAEALLETINNTESKRDLSRFFRLLDWFLSIGTSTPSSNKELISEYVSLGRSVVLFKDKFMKANFNQLFAYDVSEGALYILFVLVLLTHKESPNIFSLENIDNALNPGLVRELMTHVVDILNRDQRKQVFLTTHNPTTLDAVDIFNDEHRLFVVSRKEDGQTEFNRIMPPDNMTKEDWQNKYMGLKLSEIWLSGAIGGLLADF